MVPAGRHRQAPGRPCGRGRGQQDGARRSRAPFAAIRGEEVLGSRGCSKCGSGGWVDDLRGALPLCATGSRGGSARPMRRAGPSRCRDGGGANLGCVADPPLDDRLDLGERPLEPGAREAVEEGGEIRRFPGLEATCQEGPVRRLQAGRDRPIRGLVLGFHRAVYPRRADRTPPGMPGRFGEAMVGAVESGRDDPSVPTLPVLVLPRG